MTSNMAKGPYSMTHFWKLKLFNNVEVFKYNPFRQIWASWRVPVQMRLLSTVGKYGTGTSRKGCRRKQNRTNEALLKMCRRSILNSLRPILGSRLWIPIPPGRILNRLSCHETGFSECLRANVSIEMPICVALF